MHSQPRMYADDTSVTYASNDVEEIERCVNIDLDRIQKKEVFSFHLYYFSFYLSFRLVRKLVFLYFNVNVYLMEIPCLNKVTLPYLTLLASLYPA